MKTWSLFLAAVNLGCVCHLATSWSGSAAPQPSQRKPPVLSVCPVGHGHGRWFPHGHEDWPKGPNAIYCFVQHPKHNCNYRQVLLTILY